MSADETPALTAPLGEESNLLDPPNRNAEANVGIIICLLLTGSTVLVRAYSRIFCMKAVQIQDVIALAALGTYIGFVYVLYWFMSLCGYYVHQWNIPASDMPTFLHTIYLGMVLYELTLMGLKTSILTEWIHLFVPHGTRNAFFWTCVAIISVNVLYYTASILAVSLSCEPREMLCQKSSVIFICSAVINLVSDLVILILPIRTIWDLQLTRRKKINISLVFAIGILCCASAAIRLAMAIRAFLSPDKTFTLSSVTLWCLTEASCAFLVFCVPAAPKAFKDSRLARILWSSSTSATRPPKNGSDPASYSWQRSVHGEPTSASRTYIGSGVPLQNLHPAARGVPEGSESSEQLHVAS